MKRLLSLAVLSFASALGLASTAEASPLAPVKVPVLPGGRFGVGVGVGGGGYYGPGYANSGGYYVTQYRWVPVTTLVGYDVYRRPLYQTQYVQEAYQVWVPAVRRVYGPAYRPGVNVGVGFGYTWR